MTNLASQIADNWSRLPKTTKELNKAMENYSEYKIQSIPSLSPGHYVEATINGQRIQKGETYSNATVADIFDGKVQLGVSYNLPGTPTIFTTAFWFVRNFVKDQPISSKLTTTMDTKNKNTDGIEGTHKLKLGNKMMTVEISPTVELTSAIKAIMVLEIKYKGRTIKLIPDEDYIIRRPNGSKVTGTLERIEKIAPNKTKIQFQTSEGTKVYDLNWLEQGNIDYVGEASHLPELQRQQTQQLQNNNKSQLNQTKMTTVKSGKSTPSKPSGITAYNVKTKEKNVPMQDAVINVKNNRYIAQGTSKGGDKLTAIMNRVTAEGHVAAGNAKKGTGWPKSK